MNYSEFKSQWMNRLDFGLDAAHFPLFSQSLQEMSPGERAAVIAAVLEKGGAGLRAAEGELAFFTLYEGVVQDSWNQRDTFSLLHAMLENPEVEDRDVWKIFSSAWMRQSATQFLPEKEQWVFAYVNFRKLYASLFIDALEKNRGFEVWRGIIVPIPEETSPEISLKDLILKVLKDWPTSGRSGYALLCKLRDTRILHELEGDPEISAALEWVENRCDFGSLEKVRAALEREGR